MAISIESYNPAVNVFSEKKDAVVRITELRNDSDESLASKNVAIDLDQTPNRTPSYHVDKKAKYCLPNDSPEHVRLETQARLVKGIMHGNIFHAPISNSRVARMLDIGCGTGIVTDDMSERYPQAECIGLDLSRVPELRTHRSNIQFFQGNAISQQPTEWTPNDPGSDSLPADTDLFDYIYSRLLILEMNDWPSFVKKEYSLLRSGGWAEIHDLSWTWFDASGNNVSDKWEWLRCLNLDLQSPKKRLDTRCEEKTAQWMRDAGFVDVQVTPYKWASCGITEETPELRALGNFNAENVPKMLHFAIERAIADGQVPSPEMQLRIEELRKEMREALVSGTGLHCIMYVTVGRKP
ncbi:hypothetical protein CBER1_00782 [Cercospora berteroae]|uniref:Methyltransferase domain-containing protein n=1 Tax=Cercospora berteroae TaxID=357750 RepID=A0A2S6C1T6_9PEZI|nr:hypothetical protein CBER1_00782 [Cercospora berteroae]